MYETVNSRIPYNVSLCADQFDHGSFCMRVGLRMDQFAQAAALVKSVLPFFMRKEDRSPDGYFPFILQPSVWIIDMYDICFFVGLCRAFYRRTFYRRPFTAFTMSSAVIPYFFFSSSGLPDSPKVSC